MQLTDSHCENLFPHPDSVRSLQRSKSCCLLWKGHQLLIVTSLLQLQCEWVKNLEAVKVSIQLDVCPPSVFPPFGSHSQCNLYVLNKRKKYLGCKNSKCEVTFYVSEKSLLATPSYLIWHCSFSCWQILKVFRTFLINDDLICATGAFRIVEKWV